jgi:uncharacterized protein (UPF0335 family)
MSDDLMQIGGNAGARLKSFIERIENTQEEIDNFKEDQKEVYAEAKSVGFDVKIIRKVIKRRKMERDKRQEEDDLLEIYESAVEKMFNEMME